MISGERLRVVVVFGVLGVVALAIVLRLGALQVLPGEPLSRSARGPIESKRIDAPRGTIVDRNGAVLASDRPVYEIRAEVRTFPGLASGDRPEDPIAVDRASRHIVADLVWALSCDRVRFGDAAARDALRETLDTRLADAVGRARDAGRDHIDFLVERALDDAAAIAAVRGLDHRVRGGVVDETGEQLGYRFYVHATRRYRREYAGGDATLGLVGRVRPGRLSRLDADGKERVVDDRVAVDGLERIRQLEPREAGYSRHLVDAARHALWTNDSIEPSPGIELVTTIDLGLQLRADTEIGRAADDVTAHYGSPPEWGALLLVDVRTGGLVAAASYSAGEDGRRYRYGAFAPTSRVFEPGSVVKPLQIAFGVERGLVRWGEIVDCKPGYQAGSDELAAARPTAKSGRVITDSHPNDPLSTADVLIRSSNIGAVRLGLRLGAEGIEDYLQFYRFGSTTGVRLPGELEGDRPPPIPSLNLVDRLVYTGPSVLFGYAIAVTPLQVARAFRSFLLGRQCGIRIVEGVELDGEYYPMPAEPQGEVVLSAATRDKIKDALVGVVENEHGTAERVGVWLRALRARGHPNLEIAGKTGTSQYKAPATRWDGVRVHDDVRTASFVGFSPVREPRYLVVCVLQKVGAGSFYGGTYAAPAASRLLVDALEREPEDATARLDRSGSDALPGGPASAGAGVNERR